jgi:hypothetical protein
MQGSGENNFSGAGGYCYGRLAQEDLNRVQQLEEQLNVQRQQKLVLIAYESKAGNGVSG